MASTHKNKTFATLLAAIFGSVGVHRFFLHGSRDPWAWLHLATVPISLLAILLGGDRPVLFLASLFIASILIAFLEALVMGLRTDDKWDSLFNAGSNQKSESGWPLALLLVFTVGIGAIALIFTIARSFDLLFTGGAYG